MSAKILHSSHVDDFVEDGIVTRTEPNKAYVLVPEKGECEDCSAKIFCKSSEAKAEERTVLVIDPFGVHPGDKVRITISGGTVVMAGIYLYGIPLILLIAGLFAGMALFADSAQPEAFSFFLALALLIVYFGYIFVTGKNNPRLQALPKITQVTNTL